MPPNVGGPYQVGCLVMANDYDYVNMNPVSQSKESYILKCVLHISFPGLFKKYLWVALPH